MPNHNRANDQQFQFDQIIQLQRLIHNKALSPYGLYIIANGFIDSLIEDSEQYRLHFDRDQDISELKKLKDELPDMDAVELDIIVDNMISGMNEELQKLSLQSIIEQLGGWDVTDLAAQDVAEDISDLADQYVVEDIRDLGTPDVAENVNEAETRRQRLIDTIKHNLVHQVREDRTMVEVVSRMQYSMAELFDIFYEADIPAQQLANGLQQAGLQEQAKSELASLNAEHHHNLNKTIPPRHGFYLRLENCLTPSYDCSPYNDDDVQEPVFEAFRELGINHQDEHSMSAEALSSLIESQDEHSMSAEALSSLIESHDVIQSADSELSSLLLSDEQVYSINGYNALGLFGTNHATERAAGSYDDTEQLTCESNRLISSSESSVEHEDYKNGPDCSEQSESEDEQKRTYYSP